MRAPDTDDTQDALRRPIGYWLTAADEAITAAFEGALAEDGLTRLHWQALNVARAATTMETLLDELRGFADAERLGRVVDDLAGRGWLERSPDGRLALTCAGEAGRAQAARHADDVRRRAMEGVEERDYVTVVTTLRRVVHNLGGPTG